MNIRMLDPLLRTATIKALDGISNKVGDIKKDNAIARMLRQWKGMTQDEKENVAGIVVATATAAVATIAAIKGLRPKNVVKKGARKVVRKVAKKVF